MTVPTNLIRIIADDYALAGGVSDAILTLGQAGRLSGTGAMTSSPRWPADAARLADMPAGFQTGLHLTLTGGLAPLAALPGLAPDGQLPTLGRLLVLSHLGLLRLPALYAGISAEIARQLDAFEDAMGRAPHFIDGHQHVHLLPGVRGPLLDTLQRRYPPGSVWLRDCHEPASRIRARSVATGKALFIAMLARGLARAAASRGIPTNDGFSGIHDFTGDPGDLMPRFLSRIPPGGVIMVHPGIVDAELRMRDPLTDARQAEYFYLASPLFTDALKRAGRHIIPS